MTQYERIDDSKKMILIKLINQKSVKSVITTISTMVLIKSTSKVCNGCNWEIESFGKFAIVTVDDVDYRGFVLYDKMM